MSITIEKIEYIVDDLTLEGLIFKPLIKNNEKLPVVIVCHAFGGITTFEKEQTHRIVDELGIIGFAIDVYGKNKKPQELEECYAFMQPLVDDRSGLLRKRLLAGINALSSYQFININKISVIGYCFGGLCALDIARINVPGVLAVVSFHGNLKLLIDQPLDTANTLEPIKASILVCHGDSDPFIPQEQCSNFMEEMRARKADWQFIYYGNAKHAFTEQKHKNINIPGVGYNEAAARRSWFSMINLVKHVFNDIVETSSSK